VEIVHVSIAARGRAVIAPDEADRRRVVRGLAHRHGERLLLFSLVDDHLHAVLAALRARLAVRGLRETLRATGATPLEPAFVRPVETRRHLEWLVRYLLTQPSKHGLGVPDALWTGSSFLDLVGARRLPGFDPGLLRKHLPRLRLRDVFEAVGLEPRPLRPGSDEALERLGPRALIDLATAVHAAPPDLRGRSAEVVAARALAVRVARRTGVPVTTLARLLDRTPRGIRQLAERPVGPREVRALRTRLALEERVAGRRQLTIRERIADARAPEPRRGQQGRQ